jgi:hypothetical protein
MPYSLFLGIPVFIYALATSQSTFSTSSSHIYGRAGRIPVHNQQYGRAQPLQQQKQQLKQQQGHQQQ